MRSNSQLATLTGLMLPMSFLLAPAAGQAPGILTFFLPDSEPISLDASIIAVTNTAGIRSTPVTAMEIACPTAASPENDACRAAGIYPAQVYHTQGSVWGGTTTYAADDSTTTWRCELGSGGRVGTGDGQFETKTGSGVCAKTIVSGGATRTESVTYDGCYVIAHRLPLVVTGGADKINAAHYLTVDADAQNTQYSSELAEAKCPASQTIIWAGANAPTTEPGGSTGATTESGGGGPAATSTTQTAPAQAATSSTPVGAGHGNAPLLAVLGMGALFVFGMAF